MGTDTVEIQKDFLRSMKIYEQQKDLKLMSQDLNELRCPATQREELFNNAAKLIAVKIKHRETGSDGQYHHDDNKNLADDTGVDESHCVLRCKQDEKVDLESTDDGDLNMINPLNSRTTFGAENVHEETLIEENSARSCFIDEGGIVKNHRSLFDASKTLISDKSTTIAAINHNHELQQTTPTRRGRANEERKQKFYSDLQQSGARFKCKKCKTGRNIEVELPCATCQNQNCHADQTDQKDKTRKGISKLKL